ncbi:hypothetical protein CEXT_559381 [Caerostris extrusa]|uniref:Uncharacterized protein n=1 Tax=Caerostris extrusa TaxID=172846 RepID=A0AAV4RW44_CAEEX|nr:hypothetical protein CEXT_559381 [Caerostris extrusa]
MAMRTRGHRKCIEWHAILSLLRRYGDNEWKLPMVVFLHLHSPCRDMVIMMLYTKIEILLKYRRGALFLFNFFIECTIIDPPASIAESRESTGMVAMLTFLRHYYVDIIMLGDIMFTLLQYGIRMISFVS